MRRRRLYAISRWGSCRGMAATAASLIRLCGGGGGAGGGAGAGARGDAALSRSHAPLVRSLRPATSGTTPLQLNLSVHHKGWQLMISSVQKALISSWYPVDILDIRLISSWYPWYPADLRLISLIPDWCPVDILNPSDIRLISSWYPVDILDIRLVSDWYPWYPVDILDIRMISLIFGWYSVYILDIRLLDSIETSLFTAIFLVHYSLITVHYGI